MQKTLLLLSLGIIWRVSLLGQCQTNIDFNTWNQEGYASNGNWSVQGGGSSVFQDINGAPTFYVSPDTFMNSRISGKIRIEDNIAYDDDFVGFVFGYQEPNGIPNQYDFWLFDWKRVQQPKWNAGTQYVAQEGFTLSRVMGTIQPNNANYWPNFWAHNTTPATSPIDTDYGFGKGWGTFTDYDFTLIYTSTRATIIVNNDTIFSVPGCYEAGRFGFYNYSQPYVRYSDFSYSLISNFEIANSDYDQCINAPIDFIFSDSTCAGSNPGTSNIASWNWDFGSGNTSTQSNPVYTYNTHGIYQIKLLVTDVNGCQDSVTKQVVVHPEPIAIVAVDSIFCPVDSVGLNASGGVSYQWNPSIGVSNDTIANPLAFSNNSQNYQVIVTDQYGCQDDTTVQIHQLNAIVDPGVTICEGDTFMLGVTGGIQYEWSPIASLNDPTLANPLATPIITTTYQAIVTDIYGCVDTVFQTIQVNPKPIVNIGPDTTVCANTPVTFTASGATGYFIWSDSSGPLGTGNSITLAYPTSTWIYVIGVNNNACQNIDSVFLNVHPNPIVDPGVDEFICRYETITIGSVNNPIGTYTWSPSNQLSNPNILTPVFSPNSAGIITYTLTITDQNNCTDSASIDITIHPFQLTEVHSDVPCFGENTGISTLTTTATSPFTYTWLNALGDTITQVNSNANSASSDSLFAGAYTAILIDTFGCTDSIPIIINEPPSPLSVSLNGLINVDCFDAPSGELHVSAAGGTPGYEYSIDGGFNFNTTGSFLGLGPAIYTILVRDSNLCTTTFTDTIQTPTGLYGQITTIKHIDCFGANNGAFAIIGQGGTAPYQYSLDNINFSNNLSVNNLAPGVDTVYFFDSNGCQVEIPFQIFEPPALFSSISAQKGIDCFGNNNGQIWLTTNGGTAPYEFSLDGQNFQTDSVFANLSGGLDTLTVRDDSLCLVEFPINISEPPLLTTSILSQQNVDCYGNSTGDLIFQANGGTPSYLFSLDSINFQSDSAFNNLPVGTYTVTVLDDSSCISQLMVDITEPDSLVLSNNLQQNVDCFGNNTGFVQLSNIGGSLPYQFSLDNLNFQPDSLFQNLPAGDYTFWVVDDSSCVDTITATVLEPDSLILIVSEQIDIDCFGNNNGSVQLVADGGIREYLFGLDGNTLQVDSAFFDLIPGTHLIRVEDDSACITEIEVNILEPALLEVSASHTNVVCYNFNDGTGTVNVIGGTPGYDVLWDSPIPQTTPTAIDLAPGAYQVQVTDSNGCVDYANINVFEPDSLILVQIPDSTIEAYCDWDNGSAAVAAAGGIGPYSFQWQGPNVREGHSADMLFGDTTYQVIVTDENGCETILPVYIPQTPPATPIIGSEPTWEDSILFTQRNVQFINQSIGAVNYMWDFGDGSMSDLENPKHLFEETGVYQVRLTVDNKYLACPTDTLVTVHIIPDGTVFVPSAFTPNGDGQNDFFFAVGEGLMTYQMTIFNRWGKEIITLNNLSEQWDGRSNGGKAMPEGVYIYKVTGLRNNGQQVNMGGTVTLIR